MSIDVTVGREVGIRLEKTTMAKIWERFDPRHELFAYELWEAIVDDINTATLQPAHDTEGLLLDASHSYDEPVTKMDYILAIGRFSKSWNARSMDGGVISDGTLVAQVTDAERQRLLALVATFGQTAAEVREFVTVTVS